MNSEILITGAAGFLGTHLAALLESRGFTVRRHSSADGDISNCALHMEGVGHVFHLAGKSYVPDSWQDPRVFYRTNVMGTVNVLEHCRRSKVGLTFISSYVYGQPQRLPIAENHPVVAANPYAHTKILAEEAVRFYQQNFGLDVLIIRPFNIYGPGQRSSFLIPFIVRQVLDPLVDVIRVQNLRPKRDYLFVADAVAMLVASLRPGTSGVFNLGSGRSTSVEGVIDVVYEAAGIRKPVLSADVERPGEVMDVVADISRAATELDWRPSTSFEDGIAAVIAAERTARG